MKRLISIISAVVLFLMTITVNAEFVYPGGTSLSGNVGDSNWVIGSPDEPEDDEIAWEIGSTIWDENTPNNRVTLKLEGCNAKYGETVDVPLVISNNTGIAGAVIKISYDSRLTLVAVKKGEALGNLFFTPPAKMTSNPVTLLWDGIEADASNGVIAILTFTVPQDIIGGFEISTSYESGGIYDGDLNDIVVNNGTGYISVQSNRIKYNASLSKINLLSPTEVSGKVIAALYNEEEKLIELKIYDAKETIDLSFENSDGKHTKIMWWESLGSMKPVCNSSEWYVQSNEYIINTQQ